MTQDNLDHPLFEVKERAIIRLLQKIEYGIININELIEDCSFIPRIIRLLKDDSLVIKKYAIDLLSHILKVQEGVINFQSCAGFNVLQDIQVTVPLSMKEKIDLLLKHYQVDFVASKSEGSYIEMEHISDIENNECLRDSSIIYIQENNCLFQESNAENSCFEGSTESLLHFKNPILFTTFPWLILTHLDNKILESTAKSLVETDNVTFNGIMIFFQQILFKDFPVEVLLQRPFIMQVLLSNLAEPDEANTWRKQEVICHTLASFNRLLCSRLMKCDDSRNNNSNEGEVTARVPKHSSLSLSGQSTVSSICCSNKGLLKSSVETNNQRSSETVHESDDGDEFLILQMNQLSVVNWCCQLLTLSIYLIGTSHPRLSSVLLDLIPLIMEILRSCIKPYLIWHSMYNEHMHLEDMDLAKEIAGSLLRGLNSLSRLLNILYHKRNSNLSVTDAEENTRKLKNVSVIFKEFTKHFIPEKNFDFEMIFREQEVMSLSYLLSDIGFYSEFPQDHCRLLFIFKELKKESAVQINALIENLFRFESCKVFMQISSSEIDRFQCEAENAVPILFIHKSRVFVEKMVRGLAKHVAAAPNVTEIQISRARKLIIQLLAYPDEQSRILSFRAIYNLISENVGISQAKNISKNRSVKILILLHSRIINLLIFSGCSDSNSEIVEFSQNSILSFIRGFQLMEPEVLRQLVIVFSKCLLNLQNLASSQTMLGRAILDLPYQLLKLSSEQKSLEIICTKFHLKCLLNKDEKVREQAMRNCLVLLVMSNSETFISPGLLESPSEYCNLLILNHSVDLYASLPIVDNMDFYHLQMCLQIIDNESKDTSAIKTAWIQISFILHNPQLHTDLEKYWPIERTKQAFFNMMKVSGGGGATISQVPTVFEVLRLRAAYSADARSVLNDDLLFLMVSFKAMLFFKNNSRVQLEISLLLALLLNDDILIQSKVQTFRNNASSTSYCTASLPNVVSSSQYIIFYHENYKWEPDSSLNASTRELFSMFQSENLKIPINPVLFYKPYWALICAENDFELSLPFDYARNFSNLFKLTSIETVILRSYISKTYIIKLLTDIENATTHNDVKRSLNVLEGVLILVTDSYTKVKEVLQNDKWTGALSRFFLSLPSSSLDRQIFYHVMNVVQQLLKLINSMTLAVVNIECWCCSLVRLLITELAQEESALTSVLRLTGNVDCDPLSPTAENLHSMLIFCSLTSNISSVLHLHNQFKCECQVMQVNWSDLTSNLSKIFTSIIKKCQVIPKFNLVMLLPSLESMIKLAKVKYVDTFLHLVPVLIDLLMYFHIGRGRAHNAYLGRAVSVRCLMLLSLVVSWTQELPKMIELIVDEIPSLPWLLAALEHTDKNLVMAGLKVVLALSCSLEGTKVLDDAFGELTGGIWILIIKYLVHSDMDVMIRFLSCQILSNLCAHASYLTPSEIPWQSLSIIDTHSGQTATGKEAFREVLILFRVFPIIRQLLMTICPAKGDEKYFLPPQHDLSQMKDFFTSEESQWASIVNDLDENCVDVVSLELVEVSLGLLTNLLVIDFQFILDQCVNNYVIHVLVRRMALLTTDVKIICKWSALIECGLNILLLIGQTYSQNTHLSSLAVNLFYTEYHQSDSILKVALNVLSHMVGCGGWATVRVLELININPAQLFNHVLRCLHQFSLYQETAIAFIGALCQAGTYKSESENIILLSLKSLFDEPLYLEDHKEEAYIGWEICRHFIQLLPSKLDANLSHCYASQKEDQKLKLLLEGIKLLLCTSETGRCCAYFCSVDLLPLLQYALTNLRKKILAINIHITTNLNNNKEIKNDILFAIHCLQIATNWMGETSLLKLKILGVDSEIINPLKIGEDITPLLHPLWIPALRSFPLMEAMLQFLVSVTSHEEACSVLTRTSGMPGSLLSGSRTNKSLLVSIIISVTQNLDRRKPSRPCNNLCGYLTAELLPDALDIILNSSRVHDCAYVLVKEGFLRTVFKLLNETKELNSLVVQKCIYIVASLSFHNEARLSIAQIPNWIKCLQTFYSTDVLLRYITITFTNMIRSQQNLKNMLITDDFLSLILDMMNVRKFHAEDIHVILLCLWSLVANNHRCKKILKNLSAKPDLQTLIDNDIHSDICQNILQIIGSK